MPEPIPITRPSGCIEQPPFVTVEALAAVARSQGATQTRVFHGPDGRQWFEWWREMPHDPNAL